MVATRLYGDNELRVLWLTRGREELAVSSGGLYFRSGRRRSELTWDEVAQLQLSPVGRRAQGSALIEVFPRSGRPCAIGPFAGPEAERWLQTCREAAQAAPAPTVDLDGAVGFAVRSTS